MGENGTAVSNLNWASEDKIIGLTSRKYKDNNWFGAMYTYAIAWGCLIPYHPDDMEDSDPKKKEIASLYVYFVRIISSSTSLPLIIITPPLIATNIP